MRWTFQLALHDLMKRDERTVLLFCDVGAGLFAKHRTDFGKRVHNIGICEQATVSIAAGMAMRGLRPIVYTITPFLLRRAYEQIRLDVDEMNQPVGLVGYSDDSCGPTHDCPEARTLMDCCRNVTSYWPETKADVTRMVAEVNVDKPWWMSLRPEVKS